MTQSLPTFWFPHSRCVKGGKTQALLVIPEYHNNLLGAICSQVYGSPEVRLGAGGL